MRRSAGTGQARAEGYPQFNGVVHGIRIHAVVLASWQDNDRDLAVSAVLRSVGLSSAAEIQHFLLMRAVHDRG